MEDKREKLKQIAKIKDVIRYKYKLLKTKKFDDDSKISELLKPVITPLQNLVHEKEVKTKVKKELKSEDKIEKVKKDDHENFFDDMLFNPTMNSTLVQHKTNEKINPNTISNNENNSDNFESFSLDRTDVSRNRDNKLKIKNSSIEDERETSLNSSKLNIEKYLRRSANKHARADIVCGIRKLADGFYIGNSPVGIAGNKFTIRDTEYNLTKGLLELLFEKSPNPTLIKETDYRDYKDILLKTNAHRSRYMPDGNYRSNDKKFKEFISKLLNDDLKLGGSVGQRIKNTLIPSHMILNKNKKEYVYWNSSNELIDRLKILVLSQVAGNTSSSINNEIVSIIEELREENIIY